MSKNFLDADTIKIRDVNKFKVNWETGGIAIGALQVFEELH